MGNIKDAHNKIIWKSVLAVWRGGGYGGIERTDMPRVICYKVYLCCQMGRRLQAKVGRQSQISLGKNILNLIPSARFTVVIFDL